MQEFSPWCSQTCPIILWLKNAFEKKERRMSWQGERRTRKYLMIWDFIQSCMGIPDLSSDARVISRQALSMKAGILFFQPLHPLSAPSPACTTTSSVFLSENFVQMNTLFFLSLSNSHLIYLSFFLVSLSLSVFFYLVRTIASLS